jgi:hypothetical protein
MPEAAQGEKPALGWLYVIEDWTTGYWDGWPDGSRYERFAVQVAFGSGDGLATAVIASNSEAAQQKLDASQLMLFAMTKRK